MAGFTYCVTFRIADKTVKGKTYNERRLRLIENARTNGLSFWDGTTSFILVESSLDTYGFAEMVFAGLSEADDMVFVFDPTDMSGAYFGVVPDRNVLLSFFPKAKKLS
ncbi:hypothetical protein [Chthonobacter rhizosphaerae]|uniref:hypothetical protein n=1 Tax=Chthonobacter rhizosphaerae TaxID=2735553 RepID=UPI0015EECEC5|nr:hypothetical protein [Chthonobacter rhizosphaerae]